MASSEHQDASQITLTMPDADSDVEVSVRNWFKFKNFKFMRNSSINSPIARSSASVFKKKYYIYFGYFEPESNFSDHVNKQFSG